MAETDVSGQEVYGPLTVPVFGPGVVYDVENARFMDQKRVCAASSPHRLILSHLLHPTASERRLL